MMIAETGARLAERVVRGWVRNLAVPPLDTASAVFDAVENGTCDFGLVSRSVALSTASRFGNGTATFVIPVPAYPDIEGIGVARHARNSLSTGCCRRRSNDAMRSAHFTTRPATTSLSQRSRNALADKTSGRRAGSTKMRACSRSGPATGNAAGERDS